MTEDIEPLAPEVWFARIEMIACGGLGRVENSLRHAGHLLQLTPRPFREIVRPSPEENVFDALLEAGKFDIAARYLISQPTALCVEREPDAPVEAIISCVILKRAIRGTGETEAAAILDAWTTCMLALRTEFGADLIKLTDPSPHKARSARHRQLS